MKKIKLKISFQDKRGKIIDLLEKEKIDSITLVTFKKGAIRGNHSHKLTIQWAYLISGELLTKSRLPGHGIKELKIRPGEFFVHEKREEHAMRALKDSELLVFTKGPRAGKNYQSDTYFAGPLIAPQNK